VYIIDVLAMRAIIGLLAAIKISCVGIDHQHLPFRPISMYQTAEYFYLGTVFVALLFFMSLLVLRRRFLVLSASHSQNWHLLTDRSITGFVSLCMLIIVLFLLLLTPLQFRLLHECLAILTMILWTIHLLMYSLAGGDILSIAFSTGSAFCIVSILFWPRYFGPLEHCVLLSLLLCSLRVHRQLQ
jgi:hypothetical protein